MSMQKKAAQGECGGARGYFDFRQHESGTEARPYRKGLRVFPDVGFCVSQYSRRLISGDKAHITRRASAPGSFHSVMKSSISLATVAGWSWCIMCPAFSTQASR